MKALSLDNPWAYLVAIGAKPLETRNWKPSEAAMRAIRADGNRLAIHSTRNLKAHHAVVVDAEAAKPTWEQPFDRYLPADWNAYHDMVVSGAIVAVVELGEVRWAALVANELRDRARDKRVIEAMAFGDFSEGRWAWRLNKVKKLSEPIFCAGKQQLWDVPEPVATRIAQLLQK